ncbi:MAG TPA: PIN domain-containing protein [Thermomicrobiales bacterium]|nr:PIN domain-containing protein [Thermomicrobiales bacterium]
MTDAANNQPPVAFVDSSAIIALVNRGDPTHDQAVEAYHELVEGGYHLFTTDYVIAETLQLLDLAFGADLARQWLRDQRLPVYHADEQDVRRAIATIVSAHAGTRLSLTDAVSFVVMERLGVSDAFAVDPEFLVDSA